MMENLYQAYAYVKLFYNDASASNRNIFEYLKDNSLLIFFREQSELCECVVNIDVKPISKVLAKMIKKLPTSLIL